MLNSYSLCQDVCVRVVVGQVREKVLQWTDSNVTLAYFTKELQAEADRLFRLQGRYQGFGAVLFWGGSGYYFVPGSGAGYRGHRFLKFFWNCIRNVRKSFY